MSENKSGSGCLWWILAIILVVAIGIGVTWYVVNDGLKGSLSGTIAKLSTNSTTSGPTDDLQPNIRPDVRPPSTGSTSPEQDQQKQQEMNVNPPVYGLPGLGIPNPLKPFEQQPATPSPEAFVQKPLESLSNSGTGLNPPNLQSPSDVLKACIDLLKNYDLVGTEKYVSTNGLTFTLGTTTGVHEVLWKGLYQVQAYQSIGYDAIKVSGQTALVPLYANLGNKQVAVAYIVMAHRGDGWKLDHITDPSKF